MDQTRRPCLSCSKLDDAPILRPARSIGHGSCTRNADPVLRLFGEYCADTGPETLPRRRNACRRSESALPSRFEAQTDPVRGSTRAMRRRSSACAARKPGQDGIDFGGRNDTPSVRVQRSGHLHSHVRRMWFHPTRAPPISPTGESLSGANRNRSSAGCHTSGLATHTQFIAARISLSL